MMERYGIVEPHPSISRPGFIYGGRGGVGNYKRFTASDLTYGPIASGTASRTPLSKPFKRPSIEMTHYSSTSSASSTSSGRTNNRLTSTGIGGAGNMFKRAETEERVFMFDEEMVKRRDTASTPVYRIGRGGGGNWVLDDDDQHQHDTTTKPRTARNGSNASDTSSDSSGASVDNDARKPARRTVESTIGRIRTRLAS